MSVKHSVLQVKIKFLAKASELSGTDLDMTGLETEDHELEEEENCIMVIASNIVQHRELLQTAARSLADGGCILAREKVETNSMLNGGFRLNVVFEKTLQDEKLLLFRKVTLTQFHQEQVTPANSITLPQCMSCSHSTKQRDWRGQIQDIVMET